MRAHRSFRAARSDIEAALASLTPTSSSFDLVQSWLRDTFQPERAICYSLQETVDGFDLLQHAGLGGFAPVMRAAVKASAGTSFAYSPLRPEPDQRNRLFTHADVREVLHRRGSPPSVVPMMRAHGLVPEDQCRVLVCEGPAILGWIGCFRGEPLDSEEVSLFRSVIPVLQREAADRAPSGTGLGRARGPRGHARAHRLCGLCPRAERTAPLCEFRRPGAAEGREAAADVRARRPGRHSARNSRGSPPRGGGAGLGSGAARDVRARCRHAARSIHGPVGIDSSAGGGPRASVSGAV